MKSEHEMKTEEILELVEVARDTGWARYGPSLCPGHPSYIATTSTTAQHLTTPQGFVLVTVSLTLPDHIEGRV